MKKFFLLSILLLIIISGLLFYIYHSRKTTRSQIRDLSALLGGDIEFDFKKPMGTEIKREELEKFKKLTMNKETQKLFQLFTGEIEDNIRYFTTGKPLEYRYENHIKRVLDKVLEQIKQVKDENAQQLLQEILEGITLRMIKDHISDLNSLKKDAQQLAQERGLIFDPDLGYIMYHIDKINRDLKNCATEIEKIQAMLKDLSKDEQTAQQVMNKAAFKIKRNIQNLTIGFMISRSIKEQLEELLKEATEIKNEQMRTSLQKQINQQLQYAEDLVKQLQDLRQQTQNKAQEHNLMYEEPFID